MTDRELLQQALDVMEDLGIKEAEMVSQAIRTKLAQPEDKPNKLINVNGVLEQAGYVKKKEWVGLTEVEREEIALELPIDAVRITEAKLKEKNSE